MLTGVMAPPVLTKHPFGASSSSGIKCRCPSSFQLICPSYSLGGSLVPFLALATESAQNKAPIDPHLCLSVLRPPARPLAWVNSHVTQGHLCPPEGADREACSASPRNASLGSRPCPRNNPPRPVAEVSFAHPPHPATQALGGDPKEEAKYSGPPWGTGQQAHENHCWLFPPGTPLQPPPRIPHPQPFAGGAAARRSLPRAGRSAPRRRHQSLSWNVCGSAGLREIRSQGS